MWNGVILTLCVVQSFSPVYPVEVVLDGKYNLSSKSADLSESQPSGEPLEGFEVIGDLFNSSSKFSSPDASTGKAITSLNDEPPTSNTGQSFVNGSQQEAFPSTPDGNLASTSSYALEQVIEPPPTVPVAEFLQNHGEGAGEVSAKMRNARGPEGVDCRPNYQLVSSGNDEFESASNQPVLPHVVPTELPYEQDEDAEGTLLERHTREYEPSLISSSTIQFEPQPFDEPYDMASLGLTDGIFVFTYLGQFLSFVQPYNFPVEFVRDLLWNKVSVVNLIFQSLRFEAGFITIVVIGLLLALVIPAFALASSCSSICVPQKKKIHKSTSTFSLESIQWYRKTQVFTLFLVIAFVGAGVVAMIVTNEQLSSAMLRSPQVLSAALNDAGTYIRNTHRHISHVTLTAFDRTLTYFYRDLDGVEELLGKPIQSQVATETGVDVALDALVDVATVSDGLSSKVAELQDTSLKMRGMMSEARDRLADLRGQVEALRRACPSRDRPLCDTIESAGLEIALRTDQLNTDPRLAILRTMSGGNLPLLAERMRGRFSDIPLEIARATREIRAGLRKELDAERSVLDHAMWPLESLTRDLRSRVNEAREVAETVEEFTSGVEQWRWLSFFSTSFLVLLIWLLLTIAIVYSCCDKEGGARSLLIGAMVLSSILSLALWSIALSIMLVGGHGEVFICRPLYDQPDFKSLTELLDEPGVLFQRGGGFFRNLVPRNYSIRVPVRTILNECDNNRPAYEAFGLSSILNLDMSSDFRSWGSVLNQINNLNGNFTQLNFLDPELQEKLHSLLQATAVNMTAHRSQISRPITGKDLTSFAKQLDSVANQIKDLSTAARVETLASRTRRLISGNIQPLEGKKEELVYQVTALEVLIAPLQRQVNQSLSHLKTIQYYIDNQASNISQMKASDYTRRLTSYLNQYREQLLSNIRHGVGLCRPVFDIYHGVRHHMCRQIMDPLNGYWFAIVWCLLSLVIATPVCLKLIHYFGLHKDGLLDSSGSLGSGERGSVWTTPGNEANVDNASW